MTGKNLVHNIKILYVFAFRLDLALQNFCAKGSFTTWHMSQILPIFAQLLLHSTYPEYLVGPDTFYKICMTSIDIILFYMALHRYISLGYLIRPSPLHLNGKIEFNLQSALLQQTQQNTSIIFFRKLFLGRLLFVTSWIQQHVMNYMLLLHLHVIAYSCPCWNNCYAKFQW